MFVVRVSLPTVMVVVLMMTMIKNNMQNIMINIQMSVVRVPLPTIVVVDSDKSAEDQLRTMVTLYR